MMNRREIIFFMMLLAALSACGSSGGTEFGNPGDPPRVVKGTLSSSSSSISKQLASGCQVADTLIATDSTAGTTMETIANDCSFEITLTARKSYAFSFWLDDAFVASLTFNHGGAFLASEYMFVASGASAIDLGTITVSGRVMVSSLLPAEQIDRDGDGVNDFEDTDDDDDGIPDAEEADCDLDGIIDDEDEDQSGCEDVETDTTGIAVVLEVEPRSGEGIGNSNDAVDEDKEVKARFSCEIDETTVTAETFSVEASDDTIACVYEFSGSVERVECHHDDDLFQEATTYTVTIDGLSCSDGREVLQTSWSFATGTDDEDE